MDTKKCYACELEKSVVAFGKNRTKKDGLQTKCKDCDRQEKNAYYANNPIPQRERTKRQKAENKKWYVEYKQSCKCNKCGDNRWYVLEFHHVDSKVETIGGMMSRNQSIKRIEEELKKCIPLCANCHRELHFLQRHGDLAETE